MPENLQLSTRKSEVILAQVCVGHTPKLHPVASYLNGTRCICLCRMGATNEAEHYLLRCPDRSASRRAKLPSPRDRAGMAVQQIIRKWPEKELAFLWSEGSLKNPLHFVGIRQSAPTVKKKKVLEVQDHGPLME